MGEDLFVGRREELDHLSSLLTKKSASLIVVRGRRRVGKSRLIEEFSKGQRFLKFAGLPVVDETSEQSQRDVFAKQLGDQLELKGILANDWSTLFSLLARSTQQGRVLILFDEISWMGSMDFQFLGKLKNAWDSEFKKNPQLILVLCGSVSTWIEKNIISSKVFYGRISLFFKLEELPLNTSHELLSSRGFRSSAYEEFKILAVTSGIPWYLEHIQSTLNADDNIRNLCFREDGILFNEFNRIFHDIFEKRDAIYRPIVEAIVDNPMEFRAICKQLRYPISGTMSEYLNDLILSGFVARDYTWSLQSGKMVRLSHYRLRDNYLRFYLKVIVPHRDRILHGSFDNYMLSAMPGWNALMGLQFENLVLANRKQIWKKLGIRPEDIVADGPYFQRKSTRNKGCQIDYLIQTRYNTLFACEIKFSKNSLKTDIIDEVKEKLARLTLPRRYSCWPVLVHVNGIGDSVSDSGYFSAIIDFSRLLEER